LSTGPGYVGPVDTGADYLHRKKDALACWSNELQIPTILRDWSDEQLGIARGLLEQARPKMNGKALRHVDKAISQINIALKIR